MIRWCFSYGNIPHFDGFNGTLETKQIERLKFGRVRILSIVSKRCKSSYYQWA